jgi:hypothetical protein
MYADLGIGGVEFRIARHQFDVTLLRRAAANVLM